MTAVFLEQYLQLSVGLHAFGHHVDAQLPPECRDGADDHPAPLVRGDLGDEGTVDLELVEREST